MLREHLDGDSVLPYAIAIYSALTENASNRGEESFTTLQSHIATLAGGISTRTIRRVLPVLREIGILDYETPRLKGPITFHLLSVGTDSPNVGTNSPNDRTPMISGFQSTNRSNKEETEKEQEKGKRSAFAPPSLEESTEYGKTIGLPISEAENFHDHFTSNGWKVGGKAPMKDWQASMRTWKRRSVQFGRDAEKPKYSAIGEPLNDAARRVKAAKAGRSPL